MYRNAFVQQFQNMMLTVSWKLNQNGLVGVRLSICKFDQIQGNNHSLFPRLESMPS